MRIRSQLVLMMAAVIAPVACLAFAALVALLHVQREAEAQRLLERVSALRLALDSEIAGTQRVLRTLTGTESALPAPVLQQRLAELLRANPMWASIAVVGVDGQVRARADRPGAPGAGHVEPRTLAEAVAARAPVVSNLVAVPGGHATYVAVPDPAGAVVAMVAVDAAGWLAFLRGHAIVAGATLTLTDRDGAIVARTLNHEAWVGRPPRAEYLGHIAALDEGTFFSTGLEQQSFQSAFSRLRTAGWVLGSGMPTEQVSGALAVPASMIGAGLLLAAVTAALLALVFGRRVTVSFDRLAALDRAPPPGAPDERLPIDEAEDARRLLRRTLARESQARAEAERASRAKDEFLAMLAHELRNPLSAIRSASMLVDNPRASPQTDRRAREILQRQSGHMAALVDEMLDAARLNSGKVTLERRPTDLADIVRRALESFADAGRTAHVALHAALAPAPVRGDETRLEQIVANLLDNAAKYTPRGGTVRVTVGPARDGADEIELRIADDGAGIPASLLPHVFEAFSQAERNLDRAQGGLGLGLNIVRRLVELHGGRVDADSPGPNRGTVLTVRLPRDDGAPAAGGFFGSAAAPPPAPRSIVLVEDNHDSRDMVGALLQAAGHRVASAPDGESGLALILETRPALALVDLGLPGIDGLELARRLRAAPHGDAVALLALTGYGDAAMREAAAQAGFDGYLQKPFDLGDFDDALNTLPPPAGGVVDTPLSGR